MSATVQTLNRKASDVLKLDYVAFPNPPLTTCTARRSSRRSAATMTAGTSRIRPQLPDFTFPQSIASPEHLREIPDQQCTQAARPASYQHKRTVAISRSTSERHAQIFPPVPPIPKHFLDVSLPSTPQSPPPPCTRRPSRLKFDLPDRPEYTSTVNLASSPGSSTHTSSPPPTKTLTRRPARPDLRRGISGDSATTQSSTATSACPMLVSDDDLAGEPHTSSTLSHEDDISEADSDNITKDYETFRSITAKKLYGVSLPELEAEDDYDDDDDEGFWCSGPRGCIPNFDPEAQGPFKGKDDLIEAWIRDCTANLSVR